MALFHVLTAGCSLRAEGAPEEDTSGTTTESIGASYSNESAYCPGTTDWGAWEQTPNGNWDAAVRPVVQAIIDITGIQGGTYPGHEPSIGRAVDWRPRSREDGTRLADWLMANAQIPGNPLGIQYVIWQGQIYNLAYPASGVRQMENRGRFTPNHCDHVHLSFIANGPRAVDPSRAVAWNDCSNGSTAPGCPPPPCDARVGHFGWNCSGPVAGLTCTQINEPSDPDTWSDNYFCADYDVGVRWSSAGPITGMRCTAITESSEPDSHTRNENSSACRPTRRFAPSGVLPVRSMGNPAFPGARPPTRTRGSATSCAGQKTRRRAPMPGPSSRPTLTRERTRVPIQATRRQPPTPMQGSVRGVMARATTLETIPMEGWRRAVVAARSRRRRRASLCCG